MVHEMNLLMMECAESENDRSLLGMCRIVPMPLSSLPPLPKTTHARTALFFIKTALDLALFPCRQIGFIDFAISGLQSIPPAFEKSLYMALDNNHFRIIFLEYYKIRRTDAFFSVMNDLVRASEKVSTKLWFGPVGMMRTFLDRVTAIDQWFMEPEATSGNMFMLALYFNADLEWEPLFCRPWLGTGRTILSNVYTPRESLDTICCHLRECLSRSDHDHFRAIVGYIMTGLREHPEIYKESGVLDNLIDILVWGLYYQDDSFRVFEVLSLICRYQLGTWSLAWSSIVSNFRYYWVRFRDELPFPTDSKK
jgi:hypothetical protein